MNIGICGGTFDPFHRGHIDPVLAACETMRWDRILYIPAYRQPFKTDREHATEHHRFAMAVLATLERDEMFVLTTELERGPISYTVDTLEVLRATYVEDTLDWIIGDDNLAQLHEWKSIDRIFELTNFCVLTRSGAAGFSPRSGVAGFSPRSGVAGFSPRSGAAGFSPPEARWAEARWAEAHRSTPEARPRCGAIVFAENPTVPVSATEIRRRVAAGESIDGLVDPRVSRYIHHYGLYRKEQA